jgi:deoxyribodipyrimidine photo-lyase
VLQWAKVCREPSNLEPSIVPPIANTPSVRVQAATEHNANPDGQYVLYWMTAYRRLESNFALQRATELAVAWNKPLIVLEGLRIGYRWASDRFHRFVLDGMLDNQQAAQELPLTYLAYVEPRKGDGSGLIETLAKEACVVITDDFPCFFHPKLYKRIVSQWKAAVELVDSNGILPIHGADRTFTVAHSYRRYMQKEIARQSPIFPHQNPFRGVQLPKLKKLPEAITKRWKFLSGKELQSYDLSKLDIDHSVAATPTKGGRVEALRLLSDFAKRKLGDYDQARNEPDQYGSSSLSAHLHFGHISAHEVFQAIVSSVSGWSFSDISKPNGKMNGFWNLGVNAEAFMDQLMTWREIGFNMCARQDNYDRYESLPDWAKKTLKDHAKDKRPYVYTLEEFESARTHDSLWNAAQRQLVVEGRIHNYLRMLWGKKILHWTQSPQEALEVMIHLNNKYALDGRDPNSYSGIFWVLGRYDRAWGPEREIFGKIRYMTSESTRSKFSVKGYLRRYAELEDRKASKAKAT